MTYTWSPSAPLLARERPERAPRAAVTPSANLARLTSALAVIPNSGAQELDYDRWRNVVFALHHATDGSDEGLTLAHEFSSRSSKYDPAFLDERVWPYVRSEREGAVVTEHTLYRLAAEHGWNDPTLVDGFSVIPEDTTAVVAPAAKGARKRFEILQAAAFAARPPMPWIVKNVLPLAEAGMVFGPTGSGKSFFVLDLMFAIARRLPEWRGNRVHGGRVLYVAAEGAAGIQSRLAAYAIHHEVKLEDVDLYVLPGVPNLLEHEHVQEVIHRANEHGPFKVIVIDTLAKASAGADENSAKDMGIVLTHCQAIRQHTGAMPLLVHHTGKDTAKGARGSSAIKAGLDVEIEVARAGRARSAIVSKLKDGADEAEYPFELRTVEVGRDEDGEPITSCVLAYTTTSARAARAAQPKGATQRIAYDTVRELVGLAGESPTLEQVIEAMLPAMGAGPENDRRSNAKRALTGLEKGGFVTLQDGQVVLVEGEQ